MKPLEYKRPIEEFPDGTPRPTGLSERSDEKLRSLALDMAEGKIFTSMHLRKHEMNMLSTVFMPLVFMGAHSHKFLFEDGRITALYEYIDKAGPQGINGLPMFTSFAYLSKTEQAKVIKYHEEAKEYRAKFSQGGLGDVDEEDKAEQKDSPSESS